jgi:hypothetical protein
VNTNDLQRELEWFVWKSFELLKPLSYKFIKVTEVKVYYRFDLMIGTWLALKSRWQKRGSSVNQSYFFEYIRDYGELMIPSVRRPIKDEFSELVRLTKELKPYRGLEVKRGVEERTVYKYYCSYSLDKEEVLEISPLRVVGLILETSAPRDVKLISTSVTNESVRLTDETDIATIEDLIFDMLELYKIALKEVNKIKSHNKRIMDQMKEVLEPWMISKSLRS